MLAGKAPTATNVIPFLSSDKDSRLLAEESCRSTRVKLLPSNALVTKGNKRKEKNKGKLEYTCGKDEIKVKPS